MSDLDTIVSICPCCVCGKPVMESECVSARPPAMHVCSDRCKEIRNARSTKRSYDVKTTVITCDKRPQGIVSSGVCPQMSGVARGHYVITVEFVEEDL